MRINEVAQIGSKLINNDNKLTEQSNSNFTDIFKQAIDSVNQSQVNSDNMVQGFIKGEDVAMHDVMLSVQESQMSMQLLLEVRNKFVEAYQEINKVQL
jgi:flagellar hook-basal body complex protein FliE